MVAVLVAAAAISGSQFALKDGDRVVFYGDSITEQRLYTNYVEAFVRLRYPKLKVEFFNAGVGGDCTWGGWTGAPEERIVRDVKPHNPTLVTIMLGMNDGGYVPYDPKIFAIFQEWYGKLLGWMKMHVPRAKITLLNSPPYDDWAHPNTAFKGYSETVKRFGEYVPQLARENGLGFVEINAPLTEFIQSTVKLDSKKAATIVPDAIHPGPAGHLLIAGQLLNSWSASSLVSNVELSVSAQQIVVAENAKVDNFTGLSWTQTDSALPFPLGAEVKPASSYARLARPWNHQRLAVRGLPSGNYQLRIDGEKVVEMNSSNWERGAELSEFKTPMRTQAEKVLELTNKRNEAFFTQKRNVEFSLKGYRSTSAAAKELADVVRQIGEEQRKAAQPKPHRFELVKV